MASRPRRAAAQKANTAITDMVDSDNHISSRTGRTMSSRTSRRSEVKLPASKLRQATSSGRSGQSSRQAARENFSGGEIIEGKRNRSQKKSYVVETSEDDDEDEEEEEEEEEEDEDAEAEVDEDEDEDAEGEDDDMIDVDDQDETEDVIVINKDMDLDAEGEDDDMDAEGEDDDLDVDPTPPAPVIKVSRPRGKNSKNSSTSKPKAPAKSSAAAAAPQQRDSDDDDEELSELESEADEIQDTVNVGGAGDDDDAEGEDEEMEEAGPAEEEGDDDIDSDDETGSRAETPDLTKMTKRQRARFEEGGEEVQAKKVFTAEELSMRRAEMARRRRNLSEKRNEEVKMETINKLLKKQAPKTNRKSQLADELTPDAEAYRPSPVFVRWVSNKDGSRVAVPEEMLIGPAGKVFIRGGLKSGKMVEEVS